MIIDIIIILIIIAFIIKGIVRGFVKELSVLVGLILGFYIASQKYPLLEKLLFKTSMHLTISKIISFIIIFLIVFFVIYLLGLLLQKVVQLIMLGWLDKILGGLFGIVKGLIIIWLLLMLIVTFFPKTQRTISNSQLSLKILTLGARFTKFPTKVTKPSKLLTQSESFYIFIAEQPYRANLKDLLESI